MFQSDLRRRSGAISGSDDYDDALRTAVGRGLGDPEELFWDLAVDDIRDAADVLRDIYDRTDGADGFVSLELPPPGRSTVHRWHL